MSSNKREQTARQAGDFMRQGYHCSESIVVAVGEYLWGDVNDWLRRASTGFSGGIGNTSDELCGALSGGVLLIGALFGRTSVQQSDSKCQQLAARYRDRFAEQFGACRCCDVRRAHGSCSVLVERASRLLLDIVDEA
jgi:C_GCAxxG_C_C family probable redox protein